jgi:uncharacterized protein YecE (DUF72 family)
MWAVGTSGWQYAEWRGLFYPDGVPQRVWLERFAESFATVEINNAFYRLPERDTFVGWRERTPGDFRFAVKMSRFLTHVRRLRDPREPVERFMRRATGLGDKLGPVLLQLPPTMRADAAALDETLGCFPPGVRVAVEPRHESWWTDEIKATLERHNAALTWADRRGRPVTPLWRTADFTYVRFHEGRARPWPRYGRTSLGSWVDRVPDGDAYLYFNNDQAGAAVADARALAALARRRGRSVTRTP